MTALFLTFFVFFCFVDSFSKTKTRTTTHLTKTIEMMKSNNDDDDGGSTEEKMMTREVEEEEKEDQKDEKEENDKQVIVSFSEYNKIGLLPTP